MKEVSGYTLKAPVGAVRGQRLLIHNGEKTGIKLKGVTIESQLQLQTGEALLWLTDDSPYEEGLHIYLLEANNRIIDSLHAGADFTAGILKFSSIDQHAVDFEFFLNKITYHLEIKDKQTFIFNAPAGWSYGSLFQRHRLRVTGG